MSVDPGTHTIKQAPPQVAQTQQSSGLLDQKFNLILNSVQALQQSVGCHETKIASFESDFPCFCHFSVDFIVMTSQ